MLLGFFCQQCCVRLHGPKSANIVVAPCKRTQHVGPNNVAFCCSLVRSVLEYASSVWAGLPDYLSDLIESVQMEALRIILPNLNYDQALVGSGLQTLLERRGLACERFVQALQVSSSPCMARLLPERSSVSHGYDLRSGVTRQCISSNRLVRTDNFITFKYV